MDFTLIWIVVICFVLSTMLFWRAAGTLSPNKLNIISYVYYIFMLQTFIGTALITFGFDKHYTLNYLKNRQESLKITYCVVMAISIMMPLCIIMFEKLIKLNIKKEFNHFLNNDVQSQNANIAFYVLCICCGFALFLLMGLLIKIGYIPIIKLIHVSGDFDFALERGRISSLYFINSYINNLFVLSGIPILSYVSFSYAIVVKKRGWTILATIMFVASIIVKTYKFEKSPVLFHLVIFFLIFLFYNGKRIKTFHIIIMGIVAVIGITGMYILTGFEGTFLDIYNGPLGRTFFTEVGTLAYAFDMFPRIFPFLKGRSFAPTVLGILGIDKKLHLRSAKLTMAYYGSEKVYDGGAGVMNSLFAGEAYANFGFFGIVFSVIWIALFITAIMWIVLKLQKTPETMTYLAVMTVKVGSMLEGGFTDFVYSFDIIFLTVIILGLYWILEQEGKVQKRVLLYVKKFKK
ncbi:hypothetical protein [Faecalicatena contorta]|uniref:hypothetical protein n=1 Tax=Faecalicatena contorta TaxID=39482 RepID=UPI001F2F1008|nr:hypothetical protein [Faecalicatena contorta]MCF2555887.1 hypothetical protein [Faecalicatena contorta]